MSFFYLIVIGSMPYPLSWVSLDFGGFVANNLIATLTSLIHYILTLMGFYMTKIVRVWPGGSIFCNLERIFFIPLQTEDMWSEFLLFDFDHFCSSLDRNGQWLGLFPDRPTTGRSWNDHLRTELCALIEVLRKLWQYYLSVLDDGPAKSDATQHYDRLRNEFTNANDLK